MTGPITPETRTCGLAIASLVLSLGGFLLGPLASIPAIVTGAIARRRMAADPTLGGRGLALAGLILGWVITGLVLLFIIALVIDWGMRPSSAG